MTSMDLERPRSAVAICAIVRNEFPYLLEWLAFHSEIGVDRFLIYDHESDDGSAELLKALREVMPIEYLPWHVSSGTSPQIGACEDVQLGAYEDALNRFGKCARFIAFIDADEFLGTRSGRNLSQELVGYDPSVGAIVINQLVFGSNYEQCYRPDLVIRRFTRRAETYHAENLYFKTIVRPEMADGFSSCHSVRLRSGRYSFQDGHPHVPQPDHPGRAERVCPGELRLHHYIVKSREEFACKQARGAISDLSSGTKRYGDFFFSHREKYTNMVADDTFSRMQSVVVARMRDLLSQISGSPIYTRLVMSYQTLV